MLVLTENVGSKSIGLVRLGVGLSMAKLSFGERAGNIVTRNNEGECSSQDVFGLA
jgi:hypothetical protein